MQVTLLDPTAADWNSQVERLSSHLSDKQRPFFFPLYFLQSTLPRIGGKIASYSTNSQQIGVGLLFPRFSEANSANYFTLRYQAFGNEMSPAPDDLQRVTNQQLAPQQCIFYDPHAHHDYTQTSNPVGIVDIGHPSRAEAAQIPTLQQEIWGASAEECYPADLHSDAFALGSSLVARVDGALAGFLIGFHKFGGYPLPVDWQQRFHGELRLESQIMGVLPTYRGMRIANLLKRQQALDALQQGIKIINWTADPLQFVNASLNFSSLHAISFDFLPNLYAFRNQLNRVPASRLGLSWMIGSAHVQDRLLPQARSNIVNLSDQPTFARANQGVAHSDFTQDAPLLAFEIPANWNQLQREDLGLALQWRESTDALFRHYIGKEPGKYVIVAAGVEGERRFLIAERVSDTLWAGLS